VAEYWLDSVLIESKKRWYSFQLAPGFWSFMDTKVAEGMICASTRVYHEIVDESDDDLATWAKDRRGLPFFVDPNEEVQGALTEIADFVHGNYEPVHAQRFLAGADPWIIAHVKAAGGSLVTLETMTDPNAKKVKIPNVCAHFGVPCVSLLTMLTDLGMQL
jgi:Domain of unknown function (DUF4411)